LTGKNAPPENVASTFEIGYTNVAATDESKMVTLSDLVSVVSDRTDIPNATVFAYGRFTRQAGLISQKGRGRGAAKMSETDAANLLIGLCGTAVIREAGEAVNQFRSMKGRAYFLDDNTETEHRSWLSQFGFVRGDADKLRGDFGKFFDWLIGESKSGRLFEILEKVPVLHISDEVRAKWATHYEGFILEKAIGDGVLAPTSATVGEDVKLEAMFDRSTPGIEIRIRRMWGDNFDSVLEINFALKKQIHSSMSDLIISGTINEQILLFLGRALQGKGIMPTKAQAAPIKGTAL
jgi:hypothetical protein